MAKTFLQPELRPKPWLGRFQDNLDGTEET